MDGQQETMSHSQVTRRLVPDSGTLHGAKQRFISPGVYENWGANGRTALAWHVPEACPRRGRRTLQENCLLVRRGAPFEGVRTPPRPPRHEIRLSIVNSRHDPGPQRDRSGFHEARTRHSQIPDRARRPTLICPLKNPDTVLLSP